MTADKRPGRLQPFEQTSSAAQIKPIGPSSTMNSRSQNNNNPPYQPEQQPFNPWGEPEAPQSKATGLLSSYKKTGMLSTPNNYVVPGQNGSVPLGGQAGLSDLEEQPTAPNRFADQLSPMTNPTSPFFNPGAGMPQQGGSGMFEQGVSPFGMGGMPTAAATRNLNYLSPGSDTPGSGMLPVPTQTGSTNTVKLTGPVRVVQMPVAGQPGHYVTGFLPMLPPVTEAEAEKPAMSMKMKIIAAVLVLMVLVGATAGVISLRSQANRSDAGNQVGGSKTLSQANINATATAQANILLSDPLSQNIHSWPIAPASSYFFKNGAYHISGNGDKASAAVMKDIPFNGSFTYNLTMQEVKGDDANNTNTFGMILRYSNTKGKSKFYSFQVSNKNGGEYQFFKYDESIPNTNDPNWPWTNLWHHNFGKEFHQGHGAKNTNTFKVIVNGTKYTFVVNGKTVGNASDGGLKGGNIGMLVNQHGTEVAFSNLLVTQK